MRLDSTRFDGGGSCQTRSRRETKRRENGKSAWNERKKHEKRRPPAPATRAFLVRSAQLKHRRAATARLLLPAAALRACNQANRATGLARGCSTRIGRFRHASAVSAASRSTSILFGGLRRTSTACASQPQGCNYTGRLWFAILADAFAHLCTAHPTRYVCHCFYLPTSFFLLVRAASMLSMFQRRW